MTNEEQKLREIVERWMGKKHPITMRSYVSDLTALISEHYVSKEGYIALENMLAKTEAALMEQKQLYFKLFEEEINCMYCEAKIRRGSAIILCKECAENTEG
jgi:hypothetical protein